MASKGYVFTGEPDLSHTGHNAKKGTRRQARFPF